MTSSQEVTAFLEKMLVDGGMDNVDAEVKTQMLQDLETRLNQRVIAAVIRQLPEKDVPDFTALADRNAPQDEVMQFFADRIADLDAIVAQTMVDFRNQYVGEPVA